MIFGIEGLQFHESAEIPQGLSVQLKPGTHPRTPFQRPDMPWVEGYDDRVTEKRGLQASVIEQCFSQPKPGFRGRGRDVHGQGVRFNSSSEIKALLQFLPSIHKPPRFRRNQSLITGSGQGKSGPSSQATPTNPYLAIKGYPRHNRNCATHQDFYKAFHDFTFIMHTYTYVL